MSRQRGWEFVVAEKLMVVSLSVLPTRGHLKINLQLNMEAENMRQPLHTHTPGLNIVLQCCCSVKKSCLMCRSPPGLKY